MFKFSSILSTSFKVLFLAVILVTVSVPLIGSSSALSGSDFNPGRIIDDGIFTNNLSMSITDIQNFLNSKMTSCDTNGTTAKTYYVNSSTTEVHTFSFSGASQVNGTRASYGQAYATYWNSHTSDSFGDVRSSTYMTNESVAPYICLESYVENPTTHANNLQNPGASISGGQSAAQIIYNAAQTYNINPQVLIVTLQKEQGLVTDDWPWMNEYEIAMGYACPDGAPCNSQYFGFANQITNAAAQFRRYLTNPTNYNYVVGNNTILYNPNTSCGSSVVNIVDQSTAALYDYTPYQPNAAALKNVSSTNNGGTGDSCSAYGNRNFWWYFNTWFGTSVGPTYSWRLQTVSYSTGTNVFAAGETGTVTVTVTNTSTVPWYNYGANPVHLGTWLPGRVSPLYSSGWLSNIRPANMTENQVDPGGTATFTFPINITKLGTYIEALNLVVENSQWMPDQGLSPTINIKPAYQWQINSVNYGNGTGLMTPGTSQLVTVSALNTGADTWSKSAGPPIRLGTWQPGRVSNLMPASGSTPKDWLSSIRLTDMNESSVPPGQVGNFQFYVTPPSTGNFYEHFNLVAEGQAWFNDPGLTLYVRGGSYAWKPLWSAYSTGGNANMSPGTTFTVTVKAQNTGEVAWSNSNTASSPWPVRIATSSPENRGSILYDSSWISDIRPVALQESTVQPGQQGTFVFTAKIPADATPGPRYEHFSLVAEGISWFNDPGFYLYVNVQ